MFKNLLALFVFALIGTVVALVAATPEEFAEKLLPILMVGTVVVYLFLSWYMGYFIANQKPSVVLQYIAGIAIVIAFTSGYFIGHNKK